MQIDLTFNHSEFLKPAFFNNSKYTTIVAGRRSGKTYGAVLWVSQMLLQNTASALWVDTKHSNIDKYISRYFQPILAPIWGFCEYNQQRKVLKFPNGSYIDFGSSEKHENLEGFQYNFGVLNEAGLILKKDGLWDNTLEPMFKGDDVRVKIIGTPKGKNMFFTLHQRNDIEHYHFTAYDSPYWSKSELDARKLTLPQNVWLQEYMAEFIEGDGEVFRNIKQCIRGELIDRPVEGEQYVIGVDLAKHVDFTVIIVLSRSNRQVVYFDRFNTIDWNLQRSRIVECCHRFNNARCIIDSTGVGDSIFDSLVRDGLDVTPFKFTSSSKAQIVENLSVAIDRNEVGFPNIPELIRELEVFGYEERRNGGFTYSAPAGFHDDCVMALALANNILSNSIYIPIM